MREHIPSIVKKKLTQESQSTCPFCGEDDVSTSEFHHIIPVSKGGSNAADNLVYICANCHSKVTRGQISQDEVLRVKKILVQGRHPQLKDRGKSNVIHADFRKGSNSGVIANQVGKVEIKTTRKSVKINPPEGSIGSSLPHRNYTKYLIDRYHEFKKIEVGKEGMKYGIFYKSIERRYGAKWDMIPLAKFDDLVSYLQSRIDDTKYGKIKKANGKKIYSDFREYRKKYGGYGDL